MTRQQRQNRLLLDASGNTFYRALAVRCTFAAAVVVGLLFTVRFLPSIVGVVVSFLGVIALYALWCAGFMGAVGSLLAREPHPLRSIVLLLLYITAALIALLPALRPVFSRNRTPPNQSGLALTRTGQGRS